MSKDLVILNEENQAFTWTASNVQPINPTCQIVGMVNGSLVDATYIAYVKDLPLSYVRKGQKNHGLMNIVEGKLIQGLPIITVSSLLPGEVSYLDSNILRGYKTLHHRDVCGAFKPYDLKGKRVLVMEDLVSKATSLTTKVVEPIRARGGIVERIACMFSYGLFPAVDEKMKEAGCTLHPVYTFEHLIAGLEESQTLSKSDLAQIKEWAKDPDKWSSDWITVNEPGTN